MVFLLHLRQLIAGAVRCSGFCILLMVAALAASAARVPPQEKRSSPGQSGWGNIPGECHDPDDADSISSPETSGSTPAEKLRVCADALSQKGSWKKAEQSYESALTLDRQAGNRRAESLDLAGIGYSELRLGYPLKAEDFYQQALSIQQEISPKSLAAVRSLNGLGQAMGMYGDVAKADQYFQQAKIILKKLGRRGELDFAISLNGLGHIAELRGYAAKAEVWHRQALAIQQRLSPHCLDVADTLDFLGRASYIQSHYQRAEDYYKKSLALRKEFPEPIFDTALSIIGLGNVAYDRTELVKAKELYGRALMITEQFAPGSLIVSAVLAHRFLVEYDLGNLAKSTDYQEKAFAIQQMVAPDGLDMATSFNNLGNVLYRRGELGKAEEFGKRSLSIREKLVPGSSAVANSLRTLGAIAAERGELIWAEKYFRQALAIRSRLDPESLGVAYSLNSLGAIAHTRGNLIQASDYYRRSLRIKKKLVPKSPVVANSLINLAFIAKNVGDQAGAERYCREALAINQKLPASLTFATNLNALSQIVFDRGRFSEAETLERQALAIRQKSNPSSIQSANSFHFLGLVLRAEGKLDVAEDFHRQALRIQEKLVPGTTSHAETLAALADILRQKKQWDVAAQLYQQSLASLESQITQFGGGREGHLGFHVKYAPVYQQYIDLLMRQRKAELAFEISDRWRARSLLEMLREARADIRKGVDAQLLEEERRLQQLWVGRSNARLRLLSGHPTEAQISAANQEIGELLEHYQQLQERIRDASPEYAALMQPHTATVSEVQQLLGPDTLILEYFLGKEHSFLWVVGPTEFSSYELSNRAEIEEQARRVYRLMTAPSQIIPDETQLQKRTRIEEAGKFYWKASAKLSRMILAPAAARLGDKRLLVVADGALHYIPFAALPEPDSSKEDMHRFVQPLVVRHEIAYLPSASVLESLQTAATKRAELPGAVAVLADAVFNKGDSRVEKTRANQNYVPQKHASQEIAAISSTPLLSGSMNPNTWQQSGIRLARLPFSRMEAKSIMTLTAANKRMVALDFRANLALATSPEIARYKIIHFATHGILNSKKPELSGLVFSLVDREGRPQNGFLDLQRIYNLNLPVDLVVLSACETALGKEIQGEGLMGLTRGFLYAGALRVMASLWKVDDARTAELMRGFYEGIEHKKLQPMVALRIIQAKLWKQHPKDLPFYWAAFQIQGE